VTAAAIGAAPPAPYCSVPLAQDQEGIFNLLQTTIQTPSGELMRIDNGRISRLHQRKQ
jgi:hypothetical protein